MYAFTHKKNRQGGLTKTKGTCRLIKQPTKKDYSMSNDTMISEDPKNNCEQKSVQNVSNSPEDDADIGPEHIFRVIKDKENEGNSFYGDKRPIFDPRISWSGKGLSGYCSSEPVNSLFTLEDLTTHFADGEAEILSALEELKKYGYMKTVTKREGDRIVTYWAWIHQA